MVDYPPPSLGISPMKVIVVAFVVATITFLFWKGLWHGIAALYSAIQ